MALEFTVRDDTHFLHKENTWYPGYVDRVEDGLEGKYGPQLKWVFVLDDDPTREEWGYTSETFSPRSKAYKWVKGIYGQGPEAGQVVHLGEVFGKRVAVEFERYESDNGTRDKIVRVKGADDQPDLEPGGSLNVPEAADTPAAGDTDVPF